MTIWDRKQYKGSLLDDTGLNIRIPGGLSTTEQDWFPFVMNFNADSAFSSYMGNPDLRLTILYNFPAFSLKTHCSRLYDPSSPYYNSFYGSYVVRDLAADDTHAPYGFSYDSNELINDGKAVDGKAAVGNSANKKLIINRNDISSIPAFDYQVLVLHDFGLAYDDFKYDWQLNDITPDISYAGYEGWTRITADLTVSGAVHKARDKVFSYIQYGVPADYPYDDFTIAHMKGIIYGRYFEEENVSVFLYIVASDETVLDQCDKMILSKTSITRK